jgi:HlyD family secretion protein
LKAPAREAEIAAAEADIQRAQAQLELVQAGARPETIAAAEAEVAAAEAALEQAKVALAETELKAPSAGEVATLDAKVGEQVNPGTPMVTLADLSEWQIETDDLTELGIVKVQGGDPVMVTFDAIPDLELPGKVVRIKPIGENKMGDMTYTVIIAPDQHDERLRWNMTASVAIEPQ